MIFHFHYQTRLLTFADDTTLSVLSKSLGEVVTTLSYDLSQVDIWFKQNRMSINSTKSKVLFITSKGNSSRVVHARPQIHLSNYSAKLVNSKH